MANFPPSLPPSVEKDAPGADGRGEEENIEKGFEFPLSIRAESTGASNAPIPLTLVPTVLSFVVSRSVRLIEGRA